MKALKQAMNEIAVLRMLANQCQDSALRMNLLGKINSVEHYLKVEEKSKRD